MNFSLIGILRDVLGEALTVGKAHNERCDNDVQTEDKGLQFNHIVYFLLLVQIFEFCKALDRKENKRPDADNDHGNGE